MLNDNFGLRFNSENVTNHEECLELPNYNQCKNLKDIRGQFHKHDLALISDLPNLKRLNVRFSRKNETETKAKYSSDTLSKVSHATIAFRNSSNNQHTIHSNQ